MHHKTLYSFLFFFCLLSHLFAQEKKHKSDWEKFNLKGKVKSLNLSGYVADQESKTVKKDVKHSTGGFMVKFSPNGHETEFIEYHGNGQWFYKTKSQYNSKNQIILKKRYYSDQSDIRRIIYVYSDSMVTEIEYKSDTSKIGNTGYTKYDMNGNRIETSYKSYDGKILINHKWIYDKAGNNTETFWYDEGKIADHYIRKFDIKRNMILETRYQPMRGTTYYIDSIDYNSKNLRTRQISHAIDGQFWPTGTIKIFTFKYDTNNNVIEKISSDDTGYLLKQEWKYTYDSMGNAIVILEYQNSLLYSIEERKIEYY